MKPLHLIIGLGSLLLGYTLWEYTPTFSHLQTSIIIDEQSTLKAEYDGTEVILTRRGNTSKEEQLTRITLGEESLIQTTFTSGKNIFHDQNIQPGKTYRYVLGDHKAEAIVDTITKDEALTCTIQQGNITIQKKPSGIVLQVRELDHVSFPLEIIPENTSQAPYRLSRELFGAHNNRIILPHTSERYWVKNASCPLLDFFPKIPTPPKRAELLPFLFSQEKMQTTKEEALLILGSVERLYHTKQENITRDPCLKSSITIESTQPIESSISGTGDTLHLSPTETDMLLTFCDEMTAEVKAGSEIRLSTNPTLPRIYIKSGTITIQTPLDTLHSKARIETPHLRIEQGRGVYQLAHKEVYGKTHLTVETGKVSWYDRDTGERKEEEGGKNISHTQKEKETIKKILFPHLPRKHFLPLKQRFQDGGEMTLAKELAALIEEEYLSLPKSSTFAPKHILSGKELLALLPPTWKRNRESATFLETKPQVSFEDWKTFLEFE